MGSVEIELPFTADLDEALASEDLFKIFQLGRMVGRTESGFCPDVEFDETWAMHWDEIEQMIKNNGSTI